ncbi:DUF1643 domain-containing protein [Phormidium sp. CLA17]|uniref:DUF1643 domain-containing protein n=1 Tax=Leptolyngbya sp. Cla-17 TaxID=2803751 RepID=UPI00149315BA|nr:DUF1643 domain-containing protein [Leptolyngbya sp. Cla-17]MBM0741442.1 DUF1643 domain-containing protein [Leptolyngbya sp. Cla-17]
MKTGAIIDSTGLYRYLLWREWDAAALKVGFVMLNPSRADGTVDDPTIRRCIGFARSWGYSGLEVVNLFAYRTAKPSELRQVVDPVGIENDAYLRSLSHRVNRIVLAWGNWGTWQGRDQAVLALFGRSTQLYCLNLTKTGQPKHPLYLRATCLPVSFLVA